MARCGRSPAPGSTVRLPCTTRARPAHDLAHGSRTTPRTARARPRAGSVAAMPDRDARSAGLERRLSISGHVARLEESRSERGAWTLYVDDTPQSHVELDRPDWLGFEYVRRIGHAIDVVAAEAAPITALH